MSQDDFSPDTPWHNKERKDYEKILSAPATTISCLRDKALQLFNLYISSQLREKNPPEVTPEALERMRTYLSVSETEAIIKDFSANAEQLPCELPEGAYAIGGRSQQEAEERFNELLQALMRRIMSNLTHSAVNQGLLDCGFDEEQDAFGFSVTPAGAKFVKKAGLSHLVASEPKKSKKKKKSKE